MKQLFLIAFAVTTFTWFKTCPADEALVRTAIWAALYVLSYVVLKFAVGLFKRKRRSGR